MNLLVTVDENYIRPLKVMLYSFFASNPDEKTVTVYLIHSAIPQKALDDLACFLESFGSRLEALRVPETFFAGAVTTNRYPKEMYYRMLSPLVLPKSVDRVLYLDPDILILNPLEPLYSLDLKDRMYAAASHNGLTQMTYGINAIRLNIEHEYFNTGVILMDLEKARQIVRSTDIFTAVRKYEKDLILPDQDIFNILYGSMTMPVDDTLWNYDARKYTSYRLRSDGLVNMRWIMEHTAILHFCGRSKPWNEDGHSLFSPLYLHYLNLTERRIQSLQTDEDLEEDENPSSDERISAKGLAFSL